MKKIKFSLMSLAVVAAIASAFAMKPPADVTCDFQTQYYWDGSTFREAGVFGHDYDCDYSEIDNCTFYKPISNPNSYVPCKPGIFAIIGARKRK
jgi:hypothetical protein